MKPEDLTEEVKQRLSAGCWYEVMRVICILLLIAVFFYGVPLLGGYATPAMASFTILGMFVVARFIASMIYYRDPLRQLHKELNRELKEHKDE